MKEWIMFGKNEVVYIVATLTTCMQCDGNYGSMTKFQGAVRKGIQLRPLNPAASGELSKRFRCKNGKSCDVRNQWTVDIKSSSDYHPVRSVALQQEPREQTQNWTEI